MNRLSLSVKALLCCWLGMIAVLVWGAFDRPTTFRARWTDLPPSINLETYRAARKAAARPSFCKWNGPDTPCRVS